MSNERRPHLSVSQIEMHARCPMQWYFRYALGIKSPPGVAAVIGKGTHKAIELNLARKLAGWGLMEDDEVKTAAADATRAFWALEPPLARDGDPDQGQAVDVAVSLATLHHKALAPRIEPIAIEQAFLIDLPELSHDLLGVVDVETPTHVRDTKTKSRAPQMEAAKRSTQLAAYHLHSQLQAQQARNPQAGSKAVALDFLVKTRVPHALTIEAQPTARDHQALIRRVELTALSIDTGIFRPTNTDNWWCTQKWCGYWEMCDHGAKQKITVGLIDASRLTSRIIPHPHADAHEDPDVST